MLGGVPQAEAGATACLEGRCPLMEPSLSWDCLGWTVERSIAHHSGRPVPGQRLSRFSSRELVSRPSWNWRILTALRMLRRTYNVISA